MTAALVLCGCMGAMTPAQAHLVAAQKGTLNFAGNAAFLVLSVPVSAIHSVDDDGDGMLSKAELATHAEEVMLSEGVTDLRYFSCCVERIGYTPISIDEIRNRVAALHKETL